MKPDQPTLAPLGKRSIRSEVLDNLLSIEGRRTRLFSNAEAAIDDMTGAVIINDLIRARREGHPTLIILHGRVEDLSWHRLSAKPALSDFIWMLFSYPGRHLHAFLIKRQWVSSIRRSKELVTCPLVCIYVTAKGIEAHNVAEQLSHELSLRFARKVRRWPFRAVESTWLTSHLVLYAFRDDAFQGRLSIACRCTRRHSLLEGGDSMSFPGHPRCFGAGTCTLSDGMSLDLCTICRWLANMRHIGYLSRGFPISQSCAKYINHRCYAQGRCHHDRTLRESVEERKSRS